MAPLVESAVRDEAKQVLDGVRSWLQTWTGNLYYQLLRQLGEDTLVAGGTAELYLRPQAPWTFFRFTKEEEAEEEEEEEYTADPHQVAAGLGGLESQWRLALGLIAGRRVPPEPAGPGTPWPDLKSLLQETMITAADLGLELESVELGSFRARLRRRGLRRFLLSEEILAALAWASFLGFTPADAVEHVDVLKPDGARCELVLRADELPSQNRERLLREIGRLPERCDVKIELEGSSGARASMEFSTTPPWLG